MIECEWPTCRQEATHGKLCYSHWRQYGKTSMVDKPVVDEKERQKLFRKARAEKLKQNPNCEVEGCNERAAEVHHKRGRIGEFLYLIKHMLSTCRKHHKQIEKDPKWAKANGYSESRLSK